jgi:hypothetical protein
MRINVPLGIAIAGATFVAAGAQALGDNRASTARTGHIAAHLTNITPPDDVGTDVVVKLEGKVVAPHRNCRAGRQVRAFWIGPTGRKLGADLKLASGKGHFSLDGAILQYGTDVSEAGGRLRMTLTASKTHVAGGHSGKGYIVCQKLRETVEMDYAPSLGPIS